MTLVAAFVCKDGFTIAADSEETTGVRSQTSKLEGISWDDKRGDSFNIVIGMSGNDSVFVRELADEVKAPVLALETHTIDLVEAAIKHTVRVFWDEVLSPNLAAAPTDPPYVALLIGAMTHNEHFRVWEVSNNAVAIVKELAFIGSGRDVGAIVAERLFRPELTTAAVHYLATEIIKEGKNRAPYVGGNGETISVRTHKGRPFFEAELLHRQYLWGIEDAVASAVRCALAGEPRAVAKRLRYVIKTLRKTCKQAKAGHGSDLKLHTKDYARHELDPGVDIDTGTILDSY